MVKQVQKKKNIRTKKTRVHWNFPWTRRNLIFAAVGLGVILLGFILMATGITEEPAVADGKWNNIFAISIAPILLVIGYCIIIPFAIIKYFGKKETETTN